MNYRELLDMAIENLDKAYAPYSKCRVSAALLCKNGDVFKGVNVENVSFGATNCAERTAIFTAVTNGNLSYEAIAIATSLDYPIMPCGICRQVIVEFAPSMKIIVGDAKDYKVYTASQLLEGAFLPSDLE